MENLVNDLARTAMSQKVAAVQELTNGMQLVAYPLESGVLVCLGYGGGAAHAVASAELLRRRSENLPRYGAWQPAMFSDGSLHVVRRIDDADPDGDAPLVPAEELKIAMELLA